MFPGWLIKNKQKDICLLLLCTQSASSSLRSPTHIDLPSTHSSCIFNIAPFIARLNAVIETPVHSPPPLPPKITIKNISANSHNKMARVPKQVASADHWPHGCKTPQSCQPTRRWTSRIVRPVRIAVQRPLYISAPSTCPWVCVAKREWESAAFHYRKITSRHTPTNPPAVWPGPRTPHPTLHSPDGIQDAGDCSHETFSAYCFSPASGHPVSAKTTFVDRHL